MFENFRERLQVVQQDLSSGFVDCSLPVLEAQPSFSSGDTKPLKMYCFLSCFQHLSVV